LFVRLRRCGARPAMITISGVHAPSPGINFVLAPAGSAYPLATTAPHPALQQHHSLWLQQHRQQQPLLGQPAQAAMAFMAQQPLLAQAVVPSAKVTVAAVAAVLPIVVESLYQDQLRPYGRIVRKRITEVFEGIGQDAPDLDVRELRALCSASPWLEVCDAVPADAGSDWLATIKGRDECFVDVYRAEDRYPHELWAMLAAYFGGPAGRDMALPGGRYASAQALIRLGLPFFAGRSLGEICHIVQLAISQKKILGYLNGAVVPYNRSQSMVKERNAERRRPCTNGRRNRIVTWGVLRSSISELIDELEPGNDLIPLSNIKRTFRARFHVELSETALGYSKLSELLQDSQLHDICRVELQGHGYALVPVGRPRTSAAPTPAIVSAPAAFPSSRAQPGMAATLGPALKAPGPLQRRCRAPPLSLDDADGPEVGQLPKLLGNTSLRLGSPREKLLKDAASAPKASEHTRLIQPVPVRNIAFEQLGVDAWQQKPLTPSTLSSLGFRVQNTFIHATAPPPTPDSAKARNRASSLPRNIGGKA